MTKTQNIRSGNMKVSKMVEEISKRLSVLALGYGAERAKWQLEHGTNFLDMISKPPYSGCKTVGSLVNKIRGERSKLEVKLGALNINMPGHQFSLFEVPQEVTPEQQEEIAKEQMWLEQEIAWLHKCLGMCKNRDYFK